MMVWIKSICVRPAVRDPAAAGVRASATDARALAADQPAAGGAHLLRGGAIEDEPSVRFVLNWETDANDVDFHIYDGKGGHAYFSTRKLPSGGELYADVTTGYTLDISHDGTSVASGFSIT